MPKPFKHSQENEIKVLLELVGIFVRTLEADSSPYIKGYAELLRDELEANSFHVCDFNTNNTCKCGKVV